MVRVNNIINMKRFLEFFEDNSGGLSSTRLLLIVWGLGILTIWAVGSWIAHTLLPIPESVLIMFGTLLGGKVVQRFGEKAADPTTPQDPAAPK